MKDEILDRFYHVLLPSVSSGKGAVIDGFFFNASFSTSDCIGDKEVDIPVIDIKDKDEFNQALVSYVSSMLSFLERYPKLQDIDYVYFRGNTEAMIDASLLNVWFNATEEDFRNPVEFLNKRKAFLDNMDCINEYQKKHISKEFIGKVPYHFEYYVDTWNPSGNETPYVFRSSIVSGKDRVDFPNIAFGLDGEECYVYAVHGKKKEESNAVEKKLNRILYQANKNVVDSSPEENIRDVSVSSVCALTMFLDFLHQVSAREMIVKGNYPIRNMAKMQNQRVSFGEFTGILNNSINKYYRNFFRLQYHFPEVKLLSYPYEVDNSMHLAVPDSISYQDDFVHQIYAGFDARENDIKK